MSNVDTFIEQAERIVEKVRKTPTLTLKAQKEGRLLLRQFEKYLKGKGLGASTRMELGPKVQHYSRQRRSSA